MTMIMIMATVITMRTAITMTMAALLKLAGTSLGLQRVRRVGFGADEECVPSKALWFCLNLLYVLTSVACLKIGVFCVSAVALVIGMLLYEEHSRSLGLRGVL